MFVFILVFLSIIDVHDREPQCRGGNHTEDDSLGRLFVALARQSPAVNGFMGVEPTFITSERFAAAMNQPMRRTIPANCRKAAGVIQIEIGVTNRIRTGTNAFTGRDASCYIMITIKWSPQSDLHRRLRVYETRPVASEARGL
jgi:hypothetical protein